MGQNPQVVTNAIVQKTVMASVRIVNDLKSFFCLINMEINKQTLKTSKDNLDKHRNFTLVLYETGSNFKKRIDRLETRSIRRFATKLRSLKDLELMPEVYLRVKYTGGGYNDGFYDNYGDLIFAFKAFVEK